MKKFLLIILLLLSSVVFANNVLERHARNNFGQPIIQFYNDTPHYVSCYYRTQHGFYSFSLAPRQTSRWFRIINTYEWRCRIN